MMYSVVTNMNSLSRYRLDEPIRAVAPPEIARGIRDYYGKDKNGNLRASRLSPFSRRFDNNAAFRDKIFTTAKKLADAVFDPENPDWGDWPADIEECVGVALVLGAIFEGCADSIVLEFSEDQLASLEAESRTRSMGLSDLLFDRLTAWKEAAGDREN